jgi:hypothetical protein
MSASKWAQCPRCTINNEKEADKKDREALLSYGKVTPERYLAQLTEAAKYRADLRSEDQCTLREDYTLGTLIYKEFNGQIAFYVRYSSRCDRCGWKFTFTHDEELKL